MDALFTQGDRVRREMLRLGVRIAGPVLVSREHRVAATAAVCALMAFAGAALVPLWMVLLGPLVWGVPHVLADLRYLFVREERVRRITLAVLVALACIGLWAGRGLPAALAACAVAFALSRAPITRRVTGAVVSLLAAVAALQVGAIGDLVFLHAHNIVAVVLWWAWRRRGSSWHLLPLLLFAAASALLLGGPSPAPDGIAGTLAAPLRHLPLDPMVASIVGPTTGAAAARLLGFFAFAQAFHYAVWLRLVPEEDRVRPTAPTLRTGFRALVADLGVWMLVPAAALMIALLGWAAIDAVSARQAYIVAGSFHGYLELIAAAFLLAEGRLPRPERARG